ncbi:MAG: phage/plasmid primase, P4 family [Labilithrix sp.]
MSVTRERKPRASKPTAAAPPSHVGDQTSDDGVTAKRSDLQNAERLLKDHVGELRYVAEWKDWIVWDGPRWKRDSAAAARFAIAVTRRMMAEALEAMGHAAGELGEANASHDDQWKKEAKRDLEEAKKDLEWAATSQSSSRLNALLEVAKDLAPLRVHVDQLDADPMLLNATNGTIDLRTGLLRAHSRDDFITRMCPVAFDPDARSPLWESTLKSALGDDETVDYFHRSAGYSITGRTDEEKLFVVHGPAGGSKSTILQAAQKVLGADYAKTSDFETFLVQKHAGGPKNDIARLAGARFVASIEVEKGKRLAEGLVKTLTGGDVVTARFLYSEAFEFKPQMKLWLCVNDLPHVSADDTGMWRRIERIPFENVIAKEKRDPTVKARLHDLDVSGPAILAWLVRGALAWQKRGNLGTPTKITKATLSYRQTEDTFSQFVTECCTHPSTSSCSRKDLRIAYDGWFGGRGPLSQKGFTDKVRTLNGITEKTLGGTRFWVGIGLRTDGPGAGGAAQSFVPQTPSLETRTREEVCGTGLNSAPPAPDGGGE